MGQASAGERYGAGTSLAPVTELLKLADLDNQLDRDMRGNPQLAANWGVVKAWRVDCRYETSGLNGKDMVDSLDSPDGVLTWIKLRW